jgi:2-keto-4-pentenoate hydratase/2-oxohepta-3-ene-1,7-dioic acid hydratase in catechol pathway
MAIVLGNRGKNIPADRIRNYVWGVTLFHDWTIRDGGPRDGGSMDRAVSYNLQKNFDGAASMGPCIVVGELDPQNIDVETRVNNTVRQSYNTSEMIWSFGEVLEYLSQDFTFVPGDVIAGGTSAGTDLTSVSQNGNGFRSSEQLIEIMHAVDGYRRAIGHSAGLDSEWRRYVGKVLRAPALIIP